jgi:hypothetical protein
LNPITDKVFWLNMLFALQLQYEAMHSLSAGPGTAAWFCKSPESMGF